MLPLLLLGLSPLSKSCNLSRPCPHEMSGGLPHWYRCVLVHQSTNSVRASGIPVEGTCSSKAPPFLTRQITARAAPFRTVPG